MKTFRRSRYVRRSTRFRRRSFRRFPRPGTKRFYRRQRRWAKPEVKWTDYTIVGQTINSATNGNFAAIQNNIPIGSGPNSRVGSEVKFRKVVFRLRITCTKLTTVPVPYRTDDIVRVLIWSPVRTYEEATGYLNGTTTLLIPDWNIIKVHKDMQLKMGSAQYLPLVGNPDQLMQNVYPRTVQRNFVVPFPRTAKFGPTSDSTLVNNKDVLYLYVMNDSTSFTLTLDCDTKLTYIDP
ncbi:capsid protein [Capybara virus 17_cap1_330]|nr:capsid protein [Capybara virus 17_cap1_330]